MSVVETQNLASLLSFSCLIPQGCHDYRKNRKKPFNPEGMTSQCGYSMSPLRDFMVGYTVSSIILPLRG
ncbi:MAG: hypothetical protein JETT_2679 [Candidatus Jettenia ecosi]|uniref:Uncharacterized protein n=1 Tax=Candidatus Jettenia ecosi TaxID=2494326 RepID=A0A533QKI2_9BACT|nr:MAG: hypothetical protein JETT_2679 [Candidatus Jettenia ecosi]